MTTAYMPKMRAYVNRVRSNDALEQAGWTFVNGVYARYYRKTVGDVEYRYDPTLNQLWRGGERLGTFSECELLEHKFV